MRVTKKKKHRKSRRKTLQRRKIRMNIWVSEILQLIVILFSAISLFLFYFVRFSVFVGIASNTNRCRCSWKLLYFNFYSFVVIPPIHIFYFSRLIRSSWTHNFWWKYCSANDRDRIIKCTSANCKSARNKKEKKHQSFEMATKSDWKRKRINQIENEMNFPIE